MVMIAQHFDYSFSGLTVRSCFPIALPPSTTIGASPDILVSRASVPPHLTSASTIGPDYELKDGMFLLRLDGIARYLVLDGCRIVVDANGEADERDVHQHLLGSAFAALSHQRGLLPLHASAVQVGERCVAFCGPRCAGKSTIAAFLTKRGYPLVCDDVCVISCKTVGQPIVFPGCPQLKLQPDVLDRIAHQNWLPSERWHGKFFISAQGERPASLPLWRIYVLTGLSEPNPGRPEKLDGPRSFSKLVENTYRMHFVSPQSLKTHFALCTHVQRCVQLYSLNARKGLDRVIETILGLERHWSCVRCAISN
jgi:hypothetical protein